MDNLTQYSFLDMVDINMRLMDAYKYIIKELTTYGKPINLNEINVEIFIYTSRKVLLQYDFFYLHANNAYMCYMQVKLVQFVGAHIVQQKAHLLT